MGKINDGAKYPIDTKVSANDRLIGSDAEKGGQTKNFKVEDIANFIKDFIGNEGVGASWIYSCAGDEHEYGNFYTPGVCYTGNDDPGFQDITEIIISNNDLNNVDALRYLELANNGGVMMLLINKNDINNYLLISDLTVNSSSVPGYSTLIFSNTVTSKSFKQGDEYSFNILGSSPTFLRLVKEKKTVLANTTAPTEDDAVHIGQNNAVKVYKERVEVNHENIYFPLIVDDSIASEIGGEGIREFKVLSINAQGRIFSLPYKESQPDWLENTESSRYHIKNRFAQEEITTNYTLQPSDNGKTLFINNGPGNIKISIDRSLNNMGYFRQCRIVQLGSGDVFVAQEGGGSNYFFSTNGTGKIGGALMDAMLIRQVSEHGNVVTLGNFYLLNGQSNEAMWTDETI